MIYGSALALISGASFLETFQNRLDYLAINSLETLERALTEKEKMVIAFGGHLYKKPDVQIPFVPRGAAIALLQLLTVIETKTPEELISFLRKYSMIKNVDPAQRATIIRNAFEAAKSELRNP